MRFVGIDRGGEPRAKRKEYARKKNVLYLSTSRRNFGACQAFGIAADGRMMDPFFFFGHFCCCCLYMACVCGRFWWLFNGTAKFFSFVWLLSSISWCKVRGKRQTHLTRKCRKSKFNRCVKGNSLMTRHSTPSLFQISKLEKKKKLINWFWPKNGCDFDWFICLVHFNSISNASPLHRDL